MTQEDLYRLWYKTREEYWQNAYANLMGQLNTYRAPLLAEIERLKVAYEGTWAGVEALQRTVASLKEENRRLRATLCSGFEDVEEDEDDGCNSGYVDFQGLLRDCTQYEGCGLPGCKFPGLK